MWETGHLYLQMGNKYDIREVFDHYDVPYKDNGYGEVDYICPFHADTDYGNAKWSDVKEIYKCFACGQGGNIFRFVVMMEGGESVCSFRHAEKLIASSFTYTGEYNVNVLTKMLEQFRRKKSRAKNELVDKSVENILRALSDKKLDLGMFTNWLTIITYIQYFSNIDISKYEINAIVDLYTDFFEEINKEPIYAE